MNKNNPTANNPLLAMAVSKGLSPLSLFVNLTLINEINDIGLLPEFLSHENPLVQEAARRRQTYIMNRSKE